MSFFKRDFSRDASITVLSGAVVFVVGSIISLYHQHRVITLALKGDSIAALNVIMPSLSQFIRLSLVFGIMFLSLSLFLVADRGLSLTDHEFRICVQYVSYCALVMSSVIPSLLSTPSLSRRHITQSVTVLALWWLICTGVCALLVTDTAFGINRVVFTVLSGGPPLLLSLSIVTGIKQHRIQLDSMSNRQCVELQLLFGHVYVVCTSGFFAKGSTNFLMALSVGCALTLGVLPFVSHRALLADTKYWRGLGKANTGGIIGAAKKGPSHAGGTELQQMHPDVASSSLQATLGELDRALIDFAHIQVGDVCSRGSTAIVYFGKYLPSLASGGTTIPVAVKVWTPPDIEEGDLQTMSKEVSISMSLSHPCIVKCYGICVRPPQLAMVLEQCSRGSLSASLTRDKECWTTIRKLRACLDASRALSYLHSIDIVHKDIKLENLFVTNNWQVKLGDFGESTATVRASQLCSDPLVGSVVYMAPELIGDNASACASHPAIDVYALGITLLQVWTGGADPYDGMSTFDIYKAVEAGTRPIIPMDVPSDVQIVICKCWSHDASSRPSAADVESLLHLSWDAYTEAEAEAELSDITDTAVDGADMGRLEDSALVGFGSGDELELGYGALYNQDSTEKMPGSGDYSTVPSSCSSSREIEQSSSARSIESALSIRSRPFFKTSTSERTVGMELSGFNIERSNSGNSMEKLQRGNCFGRSASGTTSERSPSGQTRSQSRPEYHKAKSEQVIGIGKEVRPGISVSQSARVSPKEGQFRAWQDTNCQDKNIPTTSKQSIEN
jgi:serine/threonine protein kinase